MITMGSDYAHPADVRQADIYRGDRGAADCAVYDTLVLSTSSVIRQLGIEVRGLQLDEIAVNPQTEATGRFSHP